GQKRELFTYQGVKTLDEIAHPKLKFTADDRKAGIVPVPVVYHTGTYTVTRENVDLFLDLKARPSATCASPSSGPGSGPDTSSRRGGSCPTPGASPSTTGPGPRPKPWRASSTSRRSTTIRKSSSRTKRSISSTSSPTSTLTPASSSWR